MRGIAERLVDVPGDVWVKGDHLADGHGDLCSSFEALLASEAKSQRVYPWMRSDDRPFVHRCPTALARVLNHMSGAGDEPPGRVDEKVSMVPSQLMNGRASNTGELSDSSWMAGPKG